MDEWMAELQEERRAGLRSSSELAPTSPRKQILTEDRLRQEALLLGLL